MPGRRFFAAGFLGPALLLALIAVANGRPVVSPQETAVDWRTDYEKARREAKQSGKPLFVVFRCER